MRDSEVRALIEAAVRRASKYRDEAHLLTAERDEAVAGIAYWQGLWEKASLAVIDLQYEVSRLRDTVNKRNIHVREQKRAITELRGQLTIARRELEEADRHRGEDYMSQAHDLSQMLRCAERDRDRLRSALGVIAEGDTLPSYPAGLSHPDYLKHREIAHEALRGEPAPEHPVHGERA